MDNRNSKSAEAKSVARRFRWTMDIILGETIGEGLDY